MSYAFVQQKDGAIGGTGYASVATGAFGSPLTAGNHLLVVVVYFSAQTTVTLSGAGSPTWTAETPVQLAGSTGTIHCIYAENIGGGTTTGVTATFGTNVDFPAIAAFEVSGLKTSSSRLGLSILKDITPTGTDGTSAGPLTINNVPALLFGMSYDENGAELANAGTNFTALPAAADYGAGATLRPEHRRITSTGDYSTTFSYSAPGGDTAALAWAFEESTGGGVTITTNGIAVPVALGTSQIALDVNLALNGAVVPTSFGSAIVAYNEDILLNGLGLAVAFGTGAISQSGQLITPNSIAVPLSFVSNDTTAILEWEAVAGADEYRIKFGTSPGVYTGSYDTGSTATTVNISATSMAPGTTYYVVVCPLDVGVEGSPSPEVRIRPGGLSLSSENELTFTGVSVPLGIGAISVLEDKAILPTGLALGLAFGTEEVTRSNEPVTLSANGLPLALEFGTESVTLTGGPVTLSANGLALALAFGTQTLSRGTVTLTLPGLAVGAYVGRPIIYDPLIGPPDLEDRTHWRPRKLGWIVHRRWRMQ